MLRDPASEPSRTCQRTARRSGRASAAMPVWAGSPRKVGQSAAGATAARAATARRAARRFIGVTSGGGRGRWAKSGAFDTPQAGVQVPIDAAAGQAVEEDDAGAAGDTGTVWAGQAPNGGPDR